MTTTPSDTWISLLEDSCAAASISCLDLIIDQQGIARSLLPSVRSVEPPLLWYSLYTGLPEDDDDERAPLLVRVDLTSPFHRQWLIGVMRYLQDNAMLLVLASHWRFATLAEYLSQFMETRIGGELQLSRFYDPRLFPQLLSHGLHPEQRALWLRPVAFWSWLDRDGRPQYLPGLADSPDGIEPFGPIEFSDSQMRTLQCSSEATRLVEDMPCGPSAEQRFQICFAALLEATASGLLADTEREAFALDRLHGQENPNA